MLVSLQEECDEAEASRQDLCNLPWIDPEDLKRWDEPLRRREAARILHIYLQKALGRKDLPDISKAAELRDLYDCRICVNHIAQVYLRGLMKAQELSGISEKTFRIFDGQREVSTAEAEDILRELKNMIRLSDDPVCKDDPA